MSIESKMGASTSTPVAAPDKTTVQIKNFKAI